MQTILIVSRTLPAIRRTNGKVEVLIVHPEVKPSKLEGRSFEHVMFDDDLYEEELPSALQEVIRVGKVSAGVF